MNSSGTNQQKLNRKENQKSTQNQRRIHRGKTKNYPKITTNQCWIRLGVLLGALESQKRQNTNTMQTFGASIPLGFLLFDGEGRERERGKGRLYISGGGRGREREG